MPKPDRSIARKLVTLRKKRKLQLRELAAMAGVAHSTINGIELRKHGASIHTWLKLARALRVPVEEFVPQLKSG